MRSSKVNDSTTSKEMVVFDLELVPQGPDPENGATNILEHKNTVTDKSERGGRDRQNAARHGEMCRD